MMTAAHIQHEPAGGGKGEQCADPIQQGRAYMSASGRGICGVVPAMTCVAAAPAPCRRSGSFQDRSGEIADAGQVFKSVLAFGTGGFRALLGMRDGHGGP